MHDIRNELGSGRLASAVPRPSSLRLLMALSAAYFLLLFLPNLWGGYGYFIDELYYIACSKRPAFGYVDHPPLSVLILAAVRAVFGESVTAIRLLPAVFGAGVVFLTGWTARRMGAGLFGQGLAAVAYMAAAVPLVMFGFYTVNALQLLIWAALLYLLVEIADGGSTRLWIWFGVLAGLGLQNKHTLVLLAVALAVALVLTPARRHLLEMRLWLGAVIAGAIFLPNLLWQIRNGWPSLEFYRNAALLKNLPAPPWEIVKAQVLYMNPLGSLVWMAGLAYLLFSPRMRRWRALGWVFLTLLLILVISGQSRPDRITGSFPPLFAAGALLWEKTTAVRGRWIGWTLAGALLVSCAVLAPVGLPILPPDQATRYAQSLGMVPQMERGEGKKSQLPQWLADRFGWEELAADVAQVYRSLPEAERSRTVILAPSYGHAGALELFGPRYDLPPVCSPQNNYHLWGLPEREIETLISLDFGPESLDSLFEEVRPVAVYRCEYCMPWRDNMTIYIARGPKRNLREAWKSFRHYE